MYLFDTRIYCEMMTTMALANISVALYIYVCNTLYCVCNTLHTMYEIYTV